ncbi:hypothetical protein [Mesorhizobium sp. GbtcB19]|nr:hypothetical protein [Mesorhizobium sp. GbtcB19]
MSMQLRLASSEYFIVRPLQPLMPSDSAECPGRLSDLSGVMVIRTL